MTGHKSIVLFFFSGLLGLLDMPADAIFDESVEEIRKLTSDTIDCESDACSASAPSAFSPDSVNGVLADLRMDTTLPSRPRASSHGTYRTC